ncbi:MAG: excinuclease ABC subunit UvrA [Candidatus Paceibacterota bacterium]|jgi:excinuclease ABC subunit A
MKGKNEHKHIDKIIVKGARTHNLKNITVEMPRNKLIVFTGLSGSGKSSLAFDTIFAEGQRRYVESLSAYARQFLNQMQKPDVDEIEGLSPAISIDQKSAGRNPRSTVATITEIYDYLRVLYARVGKPYCLTCGERIERLSNEEIINFVTDEVKEAHKTKEKKVMGVGYSEASIMVFAPLVRGRKGEYYQLLYDLLGKGYTKVRVDGVIKVLRERIVLTKTTKHTIDAMVDEIHLSDFKADPKRFQSRLSEAVEKAITESEGLVVISINGKDTTFSAKFSCPNDGFSFPEIEPRLFSFNSPYGACAACNGLGTKYFMGREVCESCHGARLREEALHVLLGGDKKHGKNIVQVVNMPIKEAYEFFNKVKLTAKEREISKVVLKEIENRLEFLLNVGLDYLQLDRKANTLSGGEAQRIRLASQLGSRLVGALYVLDEPTIGLHQRDNERLIKTLTELRDLGNTIIVVEHDEDTIYSSDYLVDIGPGAGVHGGHIVVADDLDKLLTAKKNDSKSVTLDYLRGDKKIEIPDSRRTGERGSIKIKNGNIFNIKNLNAEVPLGRFIAVTGVSGSGKSSFMYEILYKNLQAKLEKRHRTAQTFNCEQFSGSEYVSRVIMIDQSPIGRTPRSNPATYTGAFTFIREMFASSEEARLRGWGPSRFSFNVKGGRCEACQGNGEIAVEMHFLPTVYVTCDVCNGKRFDKETLHVKYKKKNIYEVLRMTVEEALVFFEEIPAIYDRLKSLSDVGLGYLELGQSATTLSGGEAQRVKISSELYRPHIEKTIYLLDEPTIGLHYEDVKKLIEILQKLVDKGNTVMLIEHNMDIIKSADYIIDIGPDGGDKGGEIVARGTPENVAGNAKSHTGYYLKKVLKKNAP